MDWCRLWNDMPTDPKWRAIAKRSGQRIGDVIAVYTHMLTQANTASERGVIGAWDDEDVAASLDMDASEVTAIREAMQGKVLDGNSLTGWGNRQPKREDNSASRVKRYRDQKARRNADVTRGNASDTDTDTDTDKKKENRSSASADALSRDFAEWYDRYPRKVAKAKAEQAYRAARKLVDAQTLHDGLTRYLDNKPAYQDWKHPATWLNGRCWEDDYGPSGGGWKASELEALQ